MLLANSGHVKLKICRTDPREVSSIFKRIRQSIIQRRYMSFYVFWANTTFALEYVLRFRTNETNVPTKARSPEDFIFRRCIIPNTPPCSQSRVLSTYL